ncbi:MAG: DNA-binding response regulator [Cyanobacteria bacterium PR.023]|nr:DNA-binding response regulator [Cyanobacteria bacterium PR.023]MDQ5932826.1 Two component LuxR family transcriptional regulator [Cyanobacteriota bacterium erpe_2018_sw_21hr_WHONDRS-SW48-000092_B_bin.40]
MFGIVLDSMTKQISVLIVEDHDILRQGLRLVLERANKFTIVGEANNGRLGVAMAAELQPDVIVMDIGMPELNGIDATRAIKLARPDVRIVMLTAHENDNEIFAALSAGAAGYCLKDAAFDCIQVALSSVADGAAWIDPRIAQKVLKAFEQHANSQSGKQIAVEEKPIDVLSTREKDVLRLMVDGASNKEIGDKLIISLSTVRTHVEHILEKLAVTGRTAAAVKAMKEGLI